MNKSHPYFISSQIFKKKSFGKLHPLSGERISHVLELCYAMDWLDEDKIIKSSPASFDTLSRYHDAAYIQAIKEADAAGCVEQDIRKKYNFGTMENPLFDGLYKRAATTVGGSLLAAEMVAEGGVVFHPAGGTHHGWPDQARGFCYFNDPVFAILGLLDQGLQSIAYVDLDAHHGDGVEHAFIDEPKVCTISIHEQNRWPYTGTADETVREQVINLPVPEAFNDLELDYLLTQIIMPKLDAMKVDAIVITLGADALEGDPLSKMALSNQGLWQAVEQLILKSPRTIVLGGGGYNPWVTTRCWAGLWARLTGADMSLPLSHRAVELLTSFECDLIDEDEVEKRWLNTIVDAEADTGFKQGSDDMKVRTELVNLAQQTRSNHRL